VTNTSIVHYDITDQNLTIDADGNNAPSAGPNTNVCSVQLVKGVEWLMVKLQTLHILLFLVQHKVKGG
jgi:hypothetical protein